VPDPKSRMEWHSKLKTDGRKEAHNTGDSFMTPFRGRKVKVIRSQVKTASVSKRGPQLVAPSDE